MAKPPLKKPAKLQPAGGSVGGATTPPPPSVTNPGQGIPPQRRTKPRGPEVRETWLHRRAKMIKLDVAYIQDLTEYSRDEIALFAAGNFCFAGALWLAIEKGIANEWGDAVPFAIIAALGFLVMVSGWRQISRRTKRLETLLKTVEEEEDIQGR